MKRQRTDGRDRPSVSAWIGCCDEEGGERRDLLEEAGGSRLVVASWATWLKDSEKEFVVREARNAVSAAEGRAIIFCLLYERSKEQRAKAAREVALRLKADGGRDRVLFLPEKDAGLCHVTEQKLGMKSIPQVNAFQVPGPGEPGEPERAVRLQPVSVAIQPWDASRVSP